MNDIFDRTIEFVYKNKFLLNLVVSIGLWFIWFCIGVSRSMMIGEENLTNSIKFTIILCVATTLFMIIFQPLKY